MTAAGFFNQKRRDEHAAVIKAFTDVLGDAQVDRGWRASELHPRTYCVSTFCSSRFRTAAGALPGAQCRHLISAT
jgi:hypothetical protein